MTEDNVNALIMGIVTEQKKAEMNILLGEAEAEAVFNDLKKKIEEKGADKFMPIYLECVQELARLSKSPKIETEILDDLEKNRHVFESKYRESAQLLLRYGHQIEFSEESYEMISKGGKETIEKLYREFHFRFKPGDLEWLKIVDENSPDQVIKTFKALGWYNFDNLKASFPIGIQDWLLLIIDISKNIYFANDLEDIQSFIKEERIEVNKFPTQIFKLLKFYKDNRETFKTLIKFKDVVKIGDDDFEDIFISINQSSPEEKNGLFIAAQKYMFLAKEKLSLKNLMEIVRLYNEGLLEVAVTWKKIFNISGDAIFSLRIPDVKKLHQIKDSPVLRTIELLHNHFGYDYRGGYNEIDALQKFHDSGAISTLLEIERSFPVRGFETGSMDDYIAIHNLSKQKKDRYIETAKKLITEAGYSFNPADYQEILCLGEARADETAVEIHDVLNNKLYLLAKIISKC